MHPHQFKRPWIKICGFTDPENARECARFNPDAMGLVFFPRSPRNVSRDQAKQITAVLPDTILSIGVFVDSTYDEIMETVQHCRLKGVQLHGNEPFEMIDRLLAENLVVIKALFAERPPFLHQASAFRRASFLLIEHGKGTLPGGNADVWNYEIAGSIQTDTPVILAGGLNPDTISSACQLARPSGVDVSSGVETSFGIKDPEKVRRFIEQIDTGYRLPKPF